MKPTRREVDEAIDMYALAYGEVEQLRGIGSGFGYGMKEKWLKTIEELIADQNNKLKILDEMLDKIMGPRGD
jgi:hypothetical protein